MFRNYRTDRTYIIAEIGGNFTTVEQAVRLIDEAKATGVDAVKLQTYRARTLSTRGAMFDMENTGVTSQFELFQRYEVDESLHEEVFRYAEAQGLDWFSSPSHQSDVDLLERCGVGAHKVGSDDAVNLPLLRYLANTGKPIILSTGMCTLDEVRESVAAIKAQSDSRIILLHAITSYPTHPENVNLGAMQSLMREFPGLDVGYSDHTLTPVACLCAVAMGARAIERHFTYDKNADGPDHMLSADPEEMKWLVDAIRGFEVMRGSGVKEPAASERVTRINNRKSIVLERDLKAGDVISEADIAVKRPGTGIYPKHFEEVIGRRAAVDLKADTVLQWSNLA
ncbi:N-acetylneuraminate synthase family protein [Neorhizobium galegae]|uniref:N-acetylneuraminate synthase family protein n=1 Tax=Neorhizobium galegae TaxID=399 RepID=UPI000621141B|nr:N-acetylneuraminate synthase family protein [Neorhizobium galegae]KAB1121139.1 N-acylneuraminate-9-phosphate synthase [Neorhizobium galegae]MCQ1807454.1 N-acetylneuraminate synthase family protein [Neorhizobium galegae]CDZ63714.1 N-acetylneuraminate synthase [Neorhizobium galegae bv. orientalis]